MMLSRLSSVALIAFLSINAEATLVESIGRLFGWNPCQTLQRSDELLATDNRVQIGELSPQHLREAFRDPVWRGELQNRISMLQAKYPERIQWVRNVGHKFTSRDGSFTVGQRDVLVISTDGLSRDQHNQLTKDYIAAVSEGTLSHPLSEGAGHLYTRVGSYMYDFMGSNLSGKAMSALTSEKLEPVIVLKEAEFANLLNYFSSARISPEVLGSFGYEGVKGQTASRPEDNRPVDPKEVVPFVVHWTPRKLSEARPKEGQTLEWNFNIH